MAFGWRRSDQQPNLNLAVDPLGERSATVGGIGSNLDRGAGVEGRKAELVRITEQRLAPRTYSPGLNPHAAHCWLSESGFLVP
jgi:hypothetical protein